MIKRNSTLRLFILLPVLALISLQMWTPARTTLQGLEKEPKALLIRNESPTYRATLEPKEKTQPPRSASGAVIFGAVALFLSIIAASIAIYYVYLSPINSDNNNDSNLSPSNKGTQNVISKEIGNEVAAPKPTQDEKPPPSPVSVTYRQQRHTSTPTAADKTATITPTQKPHLVIIHSSPGNSIILKGLYDFLADYFVVHPIDLPGFITGKKPLDNVTFQGYCHHVEDEIKVLKLTEPYIIGGISFGFAVANRCKLEANCKAVLAILPFINADYVIEDTTYKWMTRLVEVVRWSRLHNYIYKRKRFKGLLKERAPAERVEIMLQSIDAYAFFETTRLIINDNTSPYFHPDKKYVLVVNEQDSAVKGDKIRALFRAHNAFILDTALKYHPPDLSKEHFQKHISKEKMKEVIAYLTGEKL